MQPKNTNFSDRLATAADAKKALLEKFKPKPTVIDPNPENRETRRQMELDAVRQQRAAEKEAAKAARAVAQEEARRAKLAADLAAMEAKRSAIKNRKALEKQDSQARRSARLELYGRRSVTGDTEAEAE